MVFCATFSPFRRLFRRISNTLSTFFLVPSVGALLYRHLFPIYCVSGFLPPYVVVCPFNCRIRLHHDSACHKKHMPGFRILTQFILISLDFILPDFFTLPFICCMAYLRRIKYIPCNLYHFRHYIAMRGIMA